MIEKLFSKTNKDDKNGNKSVSMKFHSNDLSFLQTESRNCIIFTQTTDNGIFQNDITRILEIHIENGSYSVLMCSLEQEGTKERFLRNH